MLTKPESPVADEAIHARHFQSWPDEARPIDWIVLHQIECAPKAGAARGVARWWSGPASPTTSAHYVLDDAECFQLVEENDQAYHCGHTGNIHGIGIEIAGWTSDGQPVWDQHPATVDRASRLVADIAARHGLPFVLLDEHQLVNGERGVTTHAAVSKAFGESSHHDPSPYLADEVVRRAALL